MYSLPDSGSLKVNVSNRQVFNIALPITVSILVPQLNLLVNSIFLGNLSIEALGNAAVTGIFYLIFAIAGNGFNSAMQTVFSRFGGSDRPDMFTVVFTQGIRITLFFAFLFILFTWLLAPSLLRLVADPVAFPSEMEFLKIRIFGLPFLYLFQVGNAFLIASLNSRFLLFGFVIQALVNIIFDYLLIFGKFGFPQMGFNGAAVASVMSEFAGMISVFLIIKSSGLRQKFNLLRNFSFNKEVSSSILRISAPLVLQYVISIGTWLAFFLLIESRGIMAKAISNTMRNIFGICGIFTWSLASTTNVMVSNLIGQGKIEKVLFITKKISAWSFMLGALLVLLLNFFPERFFMLFGQDIHFVQAGIPVIRVVSVGMLLMSLANIWLNAVTGTGKTKMNLAIELIAILAYLPYTFWVMKYNYTTLAMAWTNELIYWSVMLLIAFFYMQSGKWKAGQALSPSLK